jgi:hypothetical protein
MKFSNFKETRKEHDKPKISYPMTFAEVDVTSGIWGFECTRREKIFYQSASWRWLKSGAIIANRQLNDLSMAYIANQKLGKIMAGEIECT